MTLASIYCLGVPLLLFLVLVVIALRSYRPANRERGEEPKYRMLRDDERPRHQGENHVRRK